MSTHSIGPVRLLLGSLVLLIIGAGVFWLLWGRLGQQRVAMLREGSFEVELWSGDLTSSGSDLVWNYQPTDVELSIYKLVGDEDEEELSDPIRIPGVKKIHIDFRLGSTSIISDAVVVSMNDEPLRITVSGSQLVKKGDVWVHPGFVQGGQKRKIRIAKIEFRDGTNNVISRYQSPDQGRNVRFRVKLAQR